MRRRPHRRSDTNSTSTLRSALVDGLTARGVEGDFSFIKRQRGMFSFSGLSNEIVAWLRENKSIYVVKGGRINLAGFTSGNIKKKVWGVARYVMWMAAKERIERKRTDLNCDGLLNM